MFILIFVYVRQKMLTKPEKKLKKKLLVWETP